jgi:hypothetical protein
MVHHCGHCDGHRANAAACRKGEQDEQKRRAVVSHCDGRWDNAAANDERKAPARNVNEAVVRYIAAWNERDASRRLQLVQKLGPRTAPTSIACAMAAGTMKSMP